MERYKILLLTLGMIGLIVQIVNINQTIEPHPSKESKQKTLQNNSIHFIQETPVNSSKNKTSVEYSDRSGEHSSEFGKRAELMNEICDKYSDEHRPEFQGKCLINSNFKIFFSVFFRIISSSFHKSALMFVQKKNILHKFIRNLKTRS